MSTINSTYSVDSGVRRSTFLKGSDYTSETGHAMHIGNPACRQNCTSRRGISYGWRRLMTGIARM